MSDDDKVTHLGTDTLPPTGYLQPRRFRITCRCDVCMEEYSWETEKPSRYNRLCPNPVCVATRKEENRAKVERNRAKIFLEQRAPSVIGDKPVVRAVDTTADIVMQDYGMTDLKDNIREGDSVAPKLPAPQQRMADGFFGGKAVQAERGQGNGERLSQLIRARALSGRYRGMSVNPNLTSFGRPQGQSPIQWVRTEPLQKP